jgi:hypothetical protein
LHRTIATLLIRKSGYTKTTAQTGAVTLIQRFGGALNANIHFHMLFLDGVYIDSPHGSRARFRWVKAPTSDELTQLTHTIAQRVARFLERQGWLVREASKPAVCVNYSMKEITRVGQTVPLRARIEGLDGSASIQFTFTPDPVKISIDPISRTMTVDEVNSGEPLTRITGRIPGSFAFGVTVKILKK